MIKRGWAPIDVLVGLCAALVAAQEKATKARKPQFDAFSGVIQQERIVSRVSAVLRCRARTKNIVLVSQSRYHVLVSFLFLCNYNRDTYIGV